MESEVMTMKEAAKYLKIHIMTLYKLAREGDVPVRKVGGQWRFSRKRLREWMEEK